MGKIKQGILGGFSGKVGPVIGSSWKGKAIIKARALSYNDRNSEAQQQQRAKFGLVSQFLSTVNGFVSLGFADKAKGITAPNAAMVINLEEAISGTFPNYEINYNKVVVANGTVDLPYDPSGSVADGELTVTWADNSGQGDALATDNAMLLLYNTTQKKAVWALTDATRADRSAKITVPTAWTGDTAVAYLAMRRASNGGTSKSTYVGSYTL